MILPLRTRPVLPPTAPTSSPPPPLPERPGTAPSLTGLTLYSIRTGQLIADYMARMLELPAAPPLAYVPLAVQVQLEVAGGDPARSEGALRNNPLNLTGEGWPDQIGTWGGRFAAFSTLDAGSLAAAANYTVADVAGYYRNVVAAFLSGDPVALALAIDESPWNAGGYGFRIVAGTRAALESASEI